MRGLDVLFDGSQELCHGSMKAGGKPASLQAGTAITTLGREGDLLPGKVRSKACDAALRPDHISPVLRAEPDVRERRLALCDLTARILAQGLDLLGITTPDRM